MHLFFYISSLFCCLHLMSCEAYSNTAQQKAKVETGDTYVNENGQINLTRLNNSKMKVHFENNHGDSFDTIMEIASKENFKLAHGNYPFLKWHWGGIQMYEHAIQVVEFSSLAYISQYIQIKDIYVRPFYKLGDTIQLSGLIQRSKGDLILNGIYLLDENIQQGDFIQATGIIRKEKFPRSYYSTPESPQGMFGDTSEVHYRLVFEIIESKKVEKQTFTGTLENLNNDAAFIYDYADSEAFYMDSIYSWNENQIGKRVSIEGYLVQFENQKSLIKSWKIISEE